MKVDVFSSNIQESTLLVMEAYAYFLALFVNEECVCSLNHEAMKERDWFNSLSHGSMDTFTVALSAMETCRSSFNYFSLLSHRSTWMLFLPSYSWK